MPAARASHCAGEQGRFWELRRLLVKNADKLSVDYITGSAKTLSLDMAAFASCMTSDRFDAAIRQDVVSATAVGVSGTPSFLIGRSTAQGFEGTRIVGAQPYAVFDAQIQQLLKD
jgi:protein-disulfide isomerase